MATKGTIVFNKKDPESFFPSFALVSVQEGKPYAATLYAPDEEDDRGNPGCGLDYFVFFDDDGDRIGYAKDPENDQSDYTFTAE